MIHQIIIVEYWRRTIQGREFCSNRLFYSETFARKVLSNSGYTQVDEDIYAKDDMKAIITLRTIE